MKDICPFKASWCETLENDFRRGSGSAWGVPSVAILRIIPVSLTVLKEDGTTSLTHSHKSLKDSAQRSALSPLVEEGS